MSTELQMSLLGIIGTLLGTVLGWLLNSLSQKGHLKVFVKRWEEVFQRQDDYGGFTICNNHEDANYYNYKVSLDIYNGSRDTRIMREVTILFCKKRKVNFVSVPQDEKTQRREQPYIVYDNVSVLNVPARSALNINLRAGLNKNGDNWEAVINSDKVVLEYLNEKSRKKRIVIKKRMLQ